MTDFLRVPLNPQFCREVAEFFGFFLADFGGLVRNRRKMDTIFLFCFYFQTQKKNVVRPSFILNIDRGHYRSWKFTGLFKISLILRFFRVFFTFFTFFFIFFYFFFTSKPIQKRFPTFLTIFLRFLIDPPKSARKNPKNSATSRQNSGLRGILKA